MIVILDLYESLYKTSRTWNIIVVQTFMKLSFVYCASFPHHNNVVVHCCIIYLSAILIVFSVFKGKHPIWDNYSLWRWSAIWFMSTSENYPVCRRHFPASETYWVCKKGYFVFSLFLFSLLSCPPKYLIITLGHASFLTYDLSVLSL